MTTYHREFVSEISCFPLWDSNIVQVALRTGEFPSRNPMIRTNMYTRLFHLEGCPRCRYLAAVNMHDAIVSMRTDQSESDPQYLQSCRRSSRKCHITSEKGSSDFMNHAGCHRFPVEKQARCLAKLLCVPPHILGLSRSSPPPGSASPPRSATSSRRAGRGR